MCLKDRKDNFFFLKKILLLYLVGNLKSYRFFLCFNILVHRLFLLCATEHTSMIINPNNTLHTCTRLFIIHITHDKSHLALDIYFDYTCMVISLVPSVGFFNKLKCINCCR